MNEVERVHCLKCDDVYEEYNTFIEKFNDTYGNCLRKEQKDLLTNYIVSFTDNFLGII